MSEAVIHGFLLAIGLILPLGAQNVFVFNQGANQSKLIKAFPAVITAGVCDSILISLAVIGVSLVLMSLPLLQIVIYIIGLIFLLYMAWTLWNEAPDPIKQEGGLSTTKQISFALSVSLLNPHAIMDTIGVIGTSASAYEGNNKFAFTLTCIFVSWIWFIFLALVGKSVGTIDKSGKLLVVINKLSSIIIIAVAILIIKKLCQLLF
ncbi:LysE/ArgO family amino acid transporter [Staphylococcus capitis]|uniref:LysE/ArgO family amino acid transporter n=1 Tax=Staphylococcus capitis TaxID=29388 RepID=UPI00064A9D54|nr:LysE/ArgO family amino acid transporter [Staphylococcus capitis]AKL91319.1 Arginine exporter protein ArgO [Staphylococcus capitis subsp. capitis]MCC0829143.1 LysE/ArgO family amino acid transporter [Staphylococcus capitis]MCC3744707.1 LysE/ArgO family amino acid transporter [Staphylococcus capitis]MCC9116776.1 LysE/ArgO family amino acid transporter [Staphylococcus capitis]MCC9142908.1 LysE/ArgO family amino acid transporter [Staphylococcus capitis]